MSARRREPEAGHPIQTTGFWVFGILSLVLAVLKLMVAEHWSWCRVMLPALAFLGNNAVYVLVGFLCFGSSMQKRRKNQLPRGSIPEKGTT